MSKIAKQSSLQYFFLDTWYNKRWWAYFLLPVAWLYQLLAYLYSLIQKKRACKLSVPVVVIGNISVGGTGKTPVIISLANALSQQGISVGIVSRGYASNAPHYPYIVTAYNNDASITGDEPLLIAKATNCVVAIDKDRVAAAKYLLAEFPEIDIILSDDGLQHYRLERDLEVVVVDGGRGLGNHFCLPAGPLREPPKRLASIDWVLVNQDAAKVNANTNAAVNDSMNKLLMMTVEPKAWCNLSTQVEHSLQPLPWLRKERLVQGSVKKNSSGGNDTIKDSLKKNNPAEKEQQVKAIAGIGNPQRFFNTLHSLSIECEAFGFDDHYAFSANDFSHWKDTTVLMTEKDAVKCQSFLQDTILGEECWSLIVSITLPDIFLESVIRLVKR
ncbi:MAG: tetraacyldisaccharide 4'-kinase [Kiritimatiellia bacterium]|jgi:tetraacyldisaccharide 4'-kinase